MAEIRSTIDIVMERTKHLTMTEAEKREQNLHEFKNLSTGLIQKYRDGLMGMEQFRASIEKIQDKYKIESIEPLFDQLTRSFHIDWDNMKAKELLQGLFGVQTKRIDSIIQDYRDATGKTTRQRMKKMKEHLMKKCKVSGSAVVPRLEKDEAWAQETAKLRARFQDKLGEEFQSISKKIS